MFFCEASGAVRPYVFGIKEDRVGMPTVRFQKGGSGMVSGDHPYIRFRLKERRDDSINLFKGLYLRFKLSIFSSHIGFFEMKIEKVVLIKIFFKSNHFILDGLPSL